MKLANILKEIRIKTLNSVSPHNSNEGLCDFLNQNIEEFIKHESVDAWYEDLDDLKLKIVKNHFENNRTEIRWVTQSDEVVSVEAYHWLCPSGNPGAYGDQCEKCGTALSPTDLINPKSALSGAVPVLRETKNWFLPFIVANDAGKIGFRISTHISNLSLSMITATMDFNYNIYI